MSSRHRLRTLLVDYGVVLAGDDQADDAVVDVEAFRGRMIQPAVSLELGSDELIEAFIQRVARNADRRRTRDEQVELLMMEIIEAIETTLPDESPAFASIRLRDTPSGAGLELTRRVDRQFEASSGGDADYEWRADCN